MDILDERLAAMTEEVPADAGIEARRVARVMAPTRRRRSRWLLPVLVGGAVVLTAGTSVGVATMSNWAGVELPMANVRNEQPIPVDWTTDSGELRHCRAWIELANPQEGDQKALDAAIRTHDWTGMGQRLYDGSAPQPGDDDGSARVMDAITPVLREFAEQTFPGIPWIEPHAPAASRSVDATGVTCVPETE